MIELVNDRSRGTIEKAISHLHTGSNLNIPSNNVHYLLLSRENLCDIQKYLFILNLMDDQTRVLCIRVSANCHRQIMCYG